VASIESNPNASPNAGHRARLRQRFATDMGQAMPDYELLELLLMQLIPRRDVKPLAKQLMAHFGTFAGVIAAPLAHLQSFKGLGENTSIQLKLVQTAATRLAQQVAMQQPILSHWDALIAYCRAMHAHCTTEQFHLLYLDSKNRLIKDDIAQQGTINHAPVYPREVAKKALEYGATAVIAVHNHPSGDPSPSADDIALTQTLVQTLNAVGVMLHDHLIVAKQGETSLKALGLF
jgi:DNA repair protein RadC